MPNYLEASFKGIKRESTDLGHNKCLLRRTRDELSQGAQSHTSILSHTQTLDES
jgi:hypothetical protein